MNFILQFRNQFNKTKIAVDWILSISIINKNKEAEDIEEKRDMKTKGIWERVEEIWAKALSHRDEVN